MNEKPDCVFRASCGGASVIASGTVIPLDDSPTELSIPMGSSELTVRLIFETDKENTTSRTTASGTKENPSLVLLRIFNFTAPLGGGPVNPIPLWKSPDGQVLLMLRIYSQKNGPPLIHFTFYSKPTEIKKEEPK